MRGVPDDCVYLFKEDGTLLDEPGSFTPGGVQPLEGEIAHQRSRKFLDIANISRR